MQVNWRKQGQRWHIGVGDRLPQTLGSSDSAEGNYWIVEQIISKGLHQADEESKSYTMQLMDKLEQVRVPPAHQMR